MRSRETKKKTGKTTPVFEANTIVAEHLHAIGNSGLLSVALFANAAKVKLCFGCTETFRELHRRDGERFITEEVKNLSAAGTFEMSVRASGGIKTHFVFFERNHLRSAAGTEQTKRVVNGCARKRFDLLVECLVDIFRCRMRRMFGNEFQNRTALSGGTNAVFDKNRIGIVIGHGFLKKKWIGCIL